MVSICFAKNAFRYLAPSGVVIDVQPTVAASTATAMIRFMVFIGCFPRVKFKVFPTVALPPTSFVGSGIYGVAQGSIRL